jgi:hypothetical protein
MGTYQLLYAKDDHRKAAATLPPNKAPIFNGAGKPQHFIKKPGLSLP